MGASAVLEFGGPIAILVVVVAPMKPERTTKDHRYQDSDFGPRFSMHTSLVFPSHEAVLARGLPGVRAFLAMLVSLETRIEEVAFFILDLRSTPGATAGAQLLGQPWVDDHLRQDSFPVVVFPLSGQVDIAVMVELLAPEVGPQLGQRPPGSIDIIIVNEHGEETLLSLDVLDLLDGAG